MKTVVGWVFHLRIDYQINISDKRSINWRVHLAMLYLVFAELVKNEF